MPARVLYVNHVGRASGAEASLLGLLAHLDPTRYVARLAAPDGPFLDTARAHGVDSAPLAFGRLRRRGGVVPVACSLGRLTAAAAGLLPLVGEADLVHANSLSAALAAWPACAVHLRPLLWHCRDLRLPGRLVSLAAPRCAKVIAISAAVARQLVACGCPPERLVTIPNAIDPAPFEQGFDRAAIRSELGCGVDDDVVVCLGQFVPWKGQDRLLEAFELLAADRPRLRLAIVGDDRFGEHPEYVARLMALAQQSLLAGRVTLTGYRSDVPRVLAAADVLALPSDREPFGRVLLEAMAAGVPIVATAGGGAGEVVRHGRTGLLVATNSPADLARGIAALLDDPARRARFAAAGRGAVRRWFSPTVHAARVMAVYRDVLD